MATTPTLCHVTWQATDIQRTKAFLETLFGWNFQPVDGNYLVFKPPSGAWIGLTSVPQVRSGNAFVPQVSVPDLSEHVARAHQLGDFVVQEEGEIPGVGSYADLRDPDGTMFSIIQFSHAE